MSDKKRLLDLQDVSIVFGGLRAVSNLTMHIDEGELVGLIGPNGAGKTTAFNMITGVYLPTEGQIYFDGKLINDGHGPNLPEHPSVLRAVGTGQRKDCL